jgi:Carboxypeptidase regulatory-like domain
MRSRSSVIVALLLVLAGFARAADHRISGQLTDTQNRPVAGARVKLKAVSEAKAIEDLSDSEGRFDFRPVAPGNYEISATVLGFVETKKILRVGDDEVVTVDLRFTGLSARSEIVNVTANVRHIDTQHPDPAQQTNV